MTKEVLDPIDDEKAGGEDKNLHSLVLGIVSIILAVTAIFSLFGFIIGIIGLVIAIKHKYVMAIILNAIGIIIAFTIALVLIFTIGYFFYNSFDDNYDYDDIYHWDDDYDDYDKFDLIDCDESGVYIAEIEKESLNNGEDEYFVIGYGLDYETYHSQTIKLENLTLVVTDTNGNKREFLPLQDPLSPFLKLPEISDNLHYYIEYTMVYDIDKGDNVSSIKYEDGDYEFSCEVHN